MLRRCYGSQEFRDVCQEMEGLEMSEEHDFDDVFGKALRAKEQEEEGAKASSIQRRSTSRLLTTFSNSARREKPGSRDAPQRLHAVRR